MKNRALPARRPWSLSGVRPSTGTRLPGIEGLRAIAACSILVFHSWGLTPTIGTGRLGWFDRYMGDLKFGVVLFFTLSGFLLYRPFAAAVLRAEPRPSVRRYFRNRALRILPAYWVILLLATALGGVYVWDEHGGLVTGRLDDPLLLGRTALLLQDYSPRTIVTGIGPAWSLAVEAVFYLALPLLALAAALLARRARSRGGRRIAVLAPAGFLLLLGLSGKVAAQFLVPPRFPYEGYVQNWHSVLERSFWSQADLFTFGMVVAVLRVEWEDGLLRLPRWWRVVAAGSCVCAYVLVTTQFHDEQLSYSAANTLIAAACAVVLALVVLEPQGLLVRTLELRPLVGLGVISYSVFLWHEPLLLWLGNEGLISSGGAGFAKNLALAFGLTIVASVATYVLVEAPALRLRFHRLREPLPPEQVEAAP